MKIKKFGSVAALQKSLSKGSAADRLVWSIPKEGIKVRFMSEPDEWVHIEEHYTGSGFAICKDDCEFCSDGIRTTKRMIAAVVDVDNKRVIALKLPIGLARTLLKRYDRNSTVKDRDWDISKTGTGLETEYDVDSDGKSKFDYSRFDEIDLMAVIKKEYADPDEDDEDEALPPKKSSKPVEDDDDDDEDTASDEDDDDDTPPWATDSKKKLGKKLGR